MIMKIPLARWREENDGAISRATIRNSKFHQYQSWMKVEKDDRFDAMNVPIFPIPAFFLVDGDLAVQLHARIDAGGTRTKGGWIVTPSIRSLPMVGKILLCGELIGYIEGYHLDDKVARVHSIYLNEGRRGKKLGTRTITLLVQNAIDDSMEQFIIEDVLDKKSGETYASNPAKFEAMIGTLARAGLVSGWEMKPAEIGTNYVLRLARSVEK